MRKIFVGTIVLFLPNVSLAYNPIVVEPITPFATIPIPGDLYVEQNFLGDLTSTPDLYEFTSDVTFTFSAQLRQKKGDVYPFGLLLVRQNEGNGGVTEIVRQNVTPADWQAVNYLSLGMSFIEAPLVQRELSPGTYRVEVSTPDNYGPYMLVVGEESVRSGPIAKFSNVFVTQRHFGVFPLKAFLSPYVAVPLLLVLTLAAWLKRRWDSVKL